MFPKFLDQVAAGGVWKPTNNKVHIIREQNNYNMQIAKEVVETYPAGGSSSPPSPTFSTPCRTGAR